MTALLVGLVVFLYGAGMTMARTLVIVSMMCEQGLPESRAMYWGFSPRTQRLAERLFAATWPLVALGLVAHDLRRWWAKTKEPDSDETE